MIENSANRDPLLHLLGAMGGNDRYIADMESTGQRQLVHSDRLPVKLNGDTDADFEAVGFAFGEPDKADPLFRPATLPKGWSREAGDHSMWSYIVDAHGRRRVSIFYKAAFYDRDAFMSLATPLGDLSRFLYGEIDALPVDDWTTREVWVEVLTAHRERLLREAADDRRYGYEAGAVRSEESAARLVPLIESFGGDA